MFTKTRITLPATVAALVLSATAAVTYAAPQTDADARIAHPRVIALAEPRTAERPMSSSMAPLSMLVEDPAGNRVRLTHLPGSGWKYESSKRAAAPLRKTALQSAGAASSEGDANVSLSVFIDGPSGFTYVWNRDKGWTFIGKLVDDVM